jgi:hypothetical protein
MADEKRKTSAATKRIAFTAKEKVKVKQGGYRIREYQERYPDFSNALKGRVMTLKKP